MVVTPPYVEATPEMHSTGVIPKNLTITKLLINNLIVYTMGGL